jgi:hypothetical protein
VQDEKEKDKMKAGLSSAILSEKPNVKVSHAPLINLTFVFAQFHVGHHK